jgi:integrase
MTDYVAVINRFAAAGVIGEMDGVYSSWATATPDGFSDNDIGRTVVVPIVWARCGAIGERMRLECPLCGRRVCTLYYLEPRLACRRCNSLWYAAQRTSSYMIERAGEAARLPFPVHVHMLRHSTGYALAGRGMDTRRLQHFLGHASITNTVRYTAMSPEPFKDIWR